MRFNQRTLGIAAAIWLVLGGLGFAIANAQDETPDSQDKPAISAQQAQAAALQANPGTTAKETELEKERGMLLYEVKLNNGQEVHVDANTGNVMSNETEEGEQGEGK